MNGAKHYDELAEFRRRVGDAIAAQQSAARAIHHAREMSPTLEDLHLMRIAQVAADDIVADLHTIATHDWTAAA